VPERGGRTFTIRLRSLRPDDETIRNLRMLLKRILRSHQFRCTSIEEEKHDEH
jgi:hypothetical protein